MRLMKQLPFVRRGGAEDCSEKRVRNDAGLPAEMTPNGTAGKSLYRLRARLPLLKRNTNRG